MTNYQYDLSIVVPCFNEAKNIPYIVQRFYEIVNDYNFEVILVNNGSSDESESVFKNELAKINSPKFRTVKIDVNQGYGHGILFGLEQAKSPLLAWTHADMQTDPADIIQAWQIFQTNYNDMLLVKGSRKNRNFFDTFFSWGMEKVSSYLLKANLSEINAQPKMFTKAFYDKYLANNPPQDFSLDLFLCYCARKHGQIIEFPVFFAKRLHGEAKGGGSLKTKYKLLKRTFAYIIELKKKLSI